MLKQLGCVCLMLGVASAAGCGSSAPPPTTGFLSDYSTLSRSDDGALRYVGPELRNYAGFIVDPIEIRAGGESSRLSPQAQAEVANYFNANFARMLADRGYSITGTAGVGVARVRIALTDVQTSTWWMNLHPAGKLSGAGTGGASMEGEVIDSVTGKQLGAVIQAGRGGQFELDTFKKLDDVKDAIDKWTEAAGKRLDQMRGKA